MQWQWSPYEFGKNQLWNKAWAGFGFQVPWLNQPIWTPTPVTDQPTWVPTPGGGWAKQYPPGQVGIPYAWYPGIGLVQ